MNNNVSCSCDALTKFMPVSHINWSLSLQ